MPKQIAATENGSVYVVWIDTNSIYFTSSHDNGTKFDSPVPLTRSNNSASSPQIAATENGSVYVVWVDTNSTSGDSDIMFRASTDSGEKFGRKELSRDIRGSPSLISSSPQIAATENGSVYVVWVDKNSTNADSDIILKTITLSETRDNFGRNIHQNRNPEQILTSSSPQLAAAENGSVYGVWIENGLQFKEAIDNATTFGEAIPLGTKRNSASSPQIAATENGSVYVVWVEENSANEVKTLYLKRISQTLFDRYS